MRRRKDRGGEVRVPRFEVGVTPTDLKHGGFVSLAPSSSSCSEGVAEENFLFEIVFESE